MWIPPQDAVRSLSRTPGAWTERWVWVMRWNTSSIVRVVTMICGHGFIFSYCHVIVVNSTCLMAAWKGHLCDWFRPCREVLVFLANASTWRKTISRALRWSDCRIPILFLFPLPDDQMHWVSFLGAGADMKSSFLISSPLNNVFWKVFWVKQNPPRELKGGPWFHPLAWRRNWVVELGASTNTL